MYGAWTNDHDGCQGHVLPIVTLYSVIEFEGHVSSYSELTSAAVELHSREKISHFLMLCSIVSNVDSVNLYW